MEKLLLDLVLAGGLDHEQILPWLKERQSKISISDSIAAKLRQQQQHEQIPLEALNQLQPVLLREAVLIAVR